MRLLHVVLTVTSAAFGSGASVLVGLAVLLPTFTCSVDGKITAVLLGLVLGSSSVVDEASIICKFPKQVLRNIAKMNVPDFTLIVTAWLAVR